MNAPTPAVQPNTTKTSLPAKGGGVLDRLFPSEREQEILKDPAVMTGYYTFSFLKRDVLRLDVQFTERHNRDRIRIDLWRTVIGDETKEPVNEYMDVPRARARDLVIEVASGKVPESILSDNAGYLAEKDLNRLFFHADCSEAGHIKGVLEVKAFPAPEGGIQFSKTTFFHGDPIGSRESSPVVVPVDWTIAARVFLDMVQSRTREITRSPRQNSQGLSSR